VAYNAYDLPSIEVLVRYLDIVAGFPVKSTWISAIKVGSLPTWLGLTYTNAAKYYLESTEKNQGAHGAA